MCYIIRTLLCNCEPYVDINKICISNLTSCFLFPLISDSNPSANESDYIFDVIKGNESHVADIVFEILAKKKFKFHSFILFSVLINCS